MAALIIDVETTGLPRCNGLSYGNYPAYENIELYDTSRIVQFSMMFCNENLEEIELKDYIVRAEDFTIENSKFHGITNEISLNSGMNFIEIMQEFLIYVKQISYIIAHNANFDMNVLYSELYRAGLHLIISELKTKKIICTMKTTKFIVKAKNSYGIKDPSLAELYKFASKKNIENAHNSKYDVINLYMSIKELYNKKLFNYIYL